MRWTAATSGVTALMPPTVMMAVIPTIMMAVAVMPAIVMAVTAMPDLHEIDWRSQ